MTNPNANSDFNIPVPTDELDARPVFEPMPAGWYTNVTLQGGAQAVDGKKLDSAGNPKWRGIRIPFSGFTSKKDGKVFERDRNYQITTFSDNAKALQIGRQQLTALAVAFGLAEDAFDAAGKPAKRMTATSPEEFVSQLNAVAGSPCDAFVKIVKRTRDGVVVQRDDNSGPVLDNEISAVAALGAGK